MAFCKDIKIVVLSSFLLVCCGFEEKGLSLDDEDPNPDTAGEDIIETKPEKCANLLLEPDSFDNDTLQSQWGLFETNGGQTKIEDGELVVDLPPADVQRVAGLHSASNLLSIKDKRFFVTQTQHSLIAPERGIRLDFHSPDTGQFLGMGTFHSTVFVRYRLDDEVGAQNLRVQTIDLNLPLYMEIGESNGTIYFKAKQNSDEYILEEELQIDLTAVNQSVFSGEVRVFAVTGGSDMEPSSFAFDDFNVDPDCL